MFLAGRFSLSSAWDLCDRHTTNEQPRLAVKPNAAEDAGKRLMSTIRDYSGTDRLCFSFKLRTKSSRHAPAWRASARASNYTRWALADCAASSHEVYRCPPWRGSPMRQTPPLRNASSGLRRPRHGLKEMPTGSRLSAIGSILQLTMVEPTSLRDRVGLAPLDRPHKPKCSCVLGEADPIVTFLIRTVERLPRPPRHPPAVCRSLNVYRWRTPSA
jgi:hypothetical protein